MFPLIWWLKIRNEDLTLPCGLLKNTVTTKFEPIEENHLDKIKSKLLKEFEDDYTGELFLPAPSFLTRFDLFFAIQANHLAFPLTILFNLQRFGVGKSKKPVQSILSLNLHIVTFRPVMDSSGWEYFMHLLPTLTELKHATIAATCSHTANKFSTPSLPIISSPGTNRGEYMNLIHLVVLVPNIANDLQQVMAGPTMYRGHSQFSTLVTFVWLLSSVNVRVLFKPLSRCEHFDTFTAFVRLLSSMCSHMTFDTCFH